MQANKYKPSMFNYYTIDDNGEMIIYNSYHGLESVRKISNDKKHKVKEWLSADYNLQAKEDLDFKKMCEHEYFVPFDTDEKLRRKMMYMDYVMSNELRLVIHTTEDCNFRCQYCALDFNKRKMSIDVQNSIVDFIRKNISNYKSVRIDWFGGEPLLQMDVIENISNQIIEICKKAKKPYFSGITTNGYLLTPKTIQKLVKIKVVDYIVTIDGVEETHNKSRFLANKGPTFGKIVSNLKYIKDNIKSSVIKVTIRTNLTREILAKLPEYYEFYNKTFGDDDRFSLFIRLAGDWGGDRVKEIYDNLISNTEIGDIYSNLSTNIKNIKYDRNHFDLEVGGLACSAIFKNKFTIGVDGSIYKCDSPHKELSIGHLDEKGHMNINDMQHTRWILGHLDNNEKCNNCFYSCACFMNGCPLSKIQLNQIRCPIAPTEIDGLLKLFCKSSNIETI